jgi:hypothetical protein
MRLLHRYFLSLFSFTHSSSADASAFSVPDQSSVNAPRFSFINPQEGNSSNISFNPPTTYLPVGAFPLSKQSSDPPTPIFQPLSPTSQKQEKSNASVVVRNDSTSPFYSLKTFEELNIKPDLLKGNFTQQNTIPRTHNLKNSLDCDLTQLSNIMMI